jgi:HK97 family phage major capsid protein
MSNPVDAVRDITRGFKDVRDDVADLRERIEIAEAYRDLPRGVPRYTREDSEHKTVFLEWLRNPTNERYKMRLSEAQHEMSKKDVTIGSGPAGGYALPKEIYSQIEQRVRQLNPFRGLVDATQVGSNDFHALVSLGDGTSGWVAETGTRTATGSPNLRDRVPTMGEQYAYPTASNWSLQDLFFDVQKWLVDDVSADFAAQEATAIISGNGTARPTGVLNTTPVTTADNASPMRAASVIQYIPLSAGFPSPMRLTLDTLIDLVGSIAERYLMETDRCAFVMHRLTLAGVRKIKASTAGTYLWEPDSQSGLPTSLLGFKVLTCDAMPTNVLNNFPVIFGNWRRGYILADRVGMNIIVNQVTQPGFTSFYISRRLGGCIKNCDALKTVKVA